MTGAERDDAHSRFNSEDNLRRMKLFWTYLTNPAFVGLLASKLEGAQRLEIAKIMVDTLLYGSNTRREWSPEFSSERFIEGALALDFIVFHGSAVRGRFVPEEAWPGGEIANLAKKLFLYNAN